MVEVMSEKSSPCNCKRCPTIQVANRSDAEESSRRSGSAAARETQLHILIATEVHPVAVMTKVPNREKVGE